MPHFFSTDIQQEKTYSFCYLFYCTVFFSLLVSLPVLAAAEDDSSNDKTLITHISAKPSGKDLEISIHCDKEVHIAPLMLTGPPRIAVDIAMAEIARGVKLALPTAYNIEVSDEMMQNLTPTQLRIRFSLNKPYELDSLWKGTTFVMTLKDFFTEEQQTTSGMPSNPPADASTKEEGSVEPETEQKTEQEPEQETFEQLKLVPDTNEVLNAVANSGSNNDKSNGQAKAGAGSEEGRTSQIGENATISVDFYKIDLHNVFRMLRGITGKNIVIAQGVSGTLTLALTDVPWRFVLDIILNLKDLAKLERDNTIVIYPKNKEFVWPEPEEKSLSVEFDKDILAKEKLVITQEKDIPPEQLEAKKLIANGRAAEKKGNLEIAARFYEKALENWPKNSKLATKISTMYLAQLRQNAKAVFYAKKALKADNKNSAAALNAAIGYANMEENRKALQYFDQSVNVGKPSREALISYAAFSERHRQYDAALRLLGKLEELYGQDLNSMVAQARIYDALGDDRRAHKKYRAILHAGFRVPPDLKKFIIRKTSKR
ncbi:MAG: hypothetical protein D3919_03280 [Candidatus Electrothrix sp. AW5]|nr:hypothetical protein [Candidatus Electrothrix gigas]